MQRKGPGGSAGRGLPSVPRCQGAQSMAGPASPQSSSSEAEACSVAQAGLPSCDRPHALAHSPAVFLSYWKEINFRIP